ncbi:MAG: arabinosyltransferase domain-containing protein [Pseudonocardia sp.]
MATVADAPAHAAPPSPRGRHRSAYAAAVTGLVAVVCAVLLPFAPVLVDEPVVEWPRPDAPTSTLLPLTAQRPLEIDARFTCATAAAAGPDGVVLSTIPPIAAEAAHDGLLVTARDARLQVRAAGQVLLDEPLPAGPCEYRITGHDSGRPLLAPVPPRPATAFDPGVPRIGPDPDPARFARPGDAELVVLRDGHEVANAAPAQLPRVDALVSSADPPPTVRMRLDDEFTSRPAPLKTALITALVVALLATGALLAVATTPVPGRATPRLVRADLVADAVVGAVLLTWLFVAPATDDDGWFGVQARDGADGIRSYFQLYDHSFTPFTWPYEALHRWQEFAGTAPAVQRVPALVAGMLTWLIVRRLVAAAVHEWDGRVRARTPAVAAVAFLAWWLPYGMGVRPEALVALAAAGVLLAVLVAHRRSSPAAAWWACAAAGAGVATHPAGAVALAPLVAGAGLLWGVVAVPGERWVSAARTVAVASGLAVAPLLGFADGALRDVLRTALIVGSVRGLEGWADEPQRYAFLLDAIPMGNFARRAALLATLLALLACALLAAAAAMRRVALPPTLRLAAVSTALCLVALAVTTSKWTHHFGGLAGVGAVFLAAALLLVVPLARVLVARPPWWLVTVTGAAVAVTLGLTWQGPNAWAYAWLAGMASAYVPPRIAGIALGDPLLWAVATVAVAALLVGLGRVRFGPSGITLRPAGRRDPRWSALVSVPAVITLSLATAVGFAVTTFTTAAAKGHPADSLWVRTAADPTGCGIADGVRVLDPFTAVPLAPGPGAPVTDAFVRGGFVPGYGPQAAAGEVWGSFAGRDGRGPDDTVGRVSTGWFVLPAAGSVVVTAAGSLGEGNSLTAVYGAGGAALPVTQALADTARSPAWRTFVLFPPPGADSVRLDAVDGSTGVHGWLAFTTPAAAPAVTLQEFLPAGEPVVLGWQLAFGLPCQRPPRLADGIAEPPRFAVLRGSGPLAGLYDIGFGAAEGGAFAHVRHTGPVLQLATVGPVDPYVQVYAFGPDLARDGYTLTTGEREQPGGRVG